MGKQAKTIFGLPVTQIKSPTKLQQPPTNVSNLSGRKAVDSRKTPLPPPQSSSNLFNSSAPDTSAALGAAHVPAGEADFLGSRNNPKRKLIWVEYNTRADIVDIVPGDSIGVVLQRIHKCFGHQLKFADTSQLQLGIPLAWIPGGASAVSLEDVVDSKNKQGGGSSLSPSLMSLSMSNTGIPDNKSQMRTEAVRDISAESHPTCSEGDVDRGTCLAGSQRNVLSGDQRRVNHRQPILVLPNEKLHEGVSIGEVFAHIVAARPYAATGLSKLFTPSSFPAITHILNTRLLAFQIFVDYSNIPKHIGRTLSAETHSRNYQQPATTDPNLVKFWQQLRNATLEDDILSMPAGTYFLGDPVLGSKMYIRQAYKELALGIEQSHHTQNGFVVTGTSGMGKTYFGIWMMYLIVNGVIRLDTDLRQEPHADGTSPLNHSVIGVGQGLNKSPVSAWSANISLDASSRWASRANHLDSTCSGHEVGYNTLTGTWGAGSQLLGPEDFVYDGYVSHPVIIWDSHLRNELVVYSLEDGTVTSGWPRQSSHPAFYHSHVWYISDGDKAPLMVPAPIFQSPSTTDTDSKHVTRVNTRKTIHLTSVDTVRPAISRIIGFTAVTMPGWTFAELEYAYARCLTYGQCVLPREFSERVYLWGGNPSMVLAPSRRGDMQRHAQAALDRVDLVRILHRVVGLGVQAGPSVLKQQDKYDGGDNSDVAHEGNWGSCYEEDVAVRLVVYAMSDAHDYIVRSYRLGSAYISQKIAHALYRPIGWRDMDLAERVHAAWRFEYTSEVEQAYPHLAQIRKMLFLGHMHNSICNGGRFSTRCLSTVVSPMDGMTPGSASKSSSPSRQIPENTTNKSPIVVSGSTGSTSTEGRDKMKSPQKALTTFSSAMSPQKTLTAFSPAISPQKPLTACSPAISPLSLPMLNLTNLGLPSTVSSLPPNITISTSSVDIPSMNRFLFDSILDLSLTSYNIPKVAQFSPVDAICAPNMLFCICVNDRGRSIMVDRLRELYTQSISDDAMSAANTRPEDAAVRGETTPGKRSHNPHLRLFYAVPTMELFNSLGPQTFKVNDKWMAEEQEILQWAAENIEQYVLHIGI
ncbi:hypothetical protein BASA50_002618 [Batrachochytrium salamandrivorans]|uniref:Uncharacterized protein n=1 Tax=Batrachochytrium salamandrivorans TaxID=1357716 RepID=A0ABQ8FNP6_9FUNG|nr:hypothetical protein BASA62_001093 [Batrachochytrium salamandrivorans]KAH6600031.1 hypothetical protein BASA50_002618 [Batrachochytrium salamandrivorans]